MYPGLHWAVQMLKKTLVEQRNSPTYVSKSETKHEISPLIGARRFLHLLSSISSAALKPSEYWGVTRPARKSPIMDITRVGVCIPMIAVVVP